MSEAPKIRGGWCAGMKDGLGNFVSFQPDVEAAVKSLHARIEALHNRIGPLQIRDCDRDIRLRQLEDWKREHEGRHAPDMDPPPPPPDAPCCEWWMENNHTGRVLICERGQLMFENVHFCPNCGARKEEK